MSYMTFPFTRTADLVTEFPIEVTAEHSTVISQFQNGVVQTRARWPRARRQWVLSWSGATDEEAELVQAFGRDHLGAATPFYLEPVEPVPRPFGEPTLGQALGGALGARTRYAALTWGDGSGETTIGYTAAALAVSASYLLTVTAPTFPAGADRAWVYVGATSAVLCRQATAITTDGGTWTEPVGGYADDGASPPATNDLYETVLVRFVNDTLSTTKAQPNNWRIQAQFVEAL